MNEEPQHVPLAKPVRKAFITKQTQAQLDSDMPVNPTEEMHQWEGPGYG